jgi:hypothetical protein
MGLASGYSKPTSFEDMEEGVDGVAGVVSSTPEAVVASTEAEIVAEEVTKEE